MKTCLKIRYRYLPTDQLLRLLIVISSPKRNEFEPGKNRNHNEATTRFLYGDCDPLL